jgi:two-component system phosphate regulon sensor histidine kinase PhoR
MALSSWLPWACLAAAVALLLGQARRTARLDRELTTARRILAKGQQDRRAESGDFRALAEEVVGDNQSLRSRARLLEMALAGMNEGVLVVGVNREVLAANSAALKLLGTEPADPASWIGTRLVRMSRQPSLVELVEAALDEGRAGQAQVEIRTGTLRVLAASAVPLRVGGEIVACVAGLVDATQLRQLERVRQDFVANVSHELRTPVTAIVGWSETRAEMDPPQALVEPIETIRTHAERLQTLVSDLLTLSRLESVGLEDGYVEIDLEHIVADVFSEIRPAADKQRITISCRIDAGCRFIVSEPRALQYVLRNLVENGVKYTSEGGRVELRARVDAEDMLRLEVQDTGIGIPAAHLGRIFERFYRVDRGRSREGGGTGLGLSIVKHFATALGGSVEVTSQVGQGSLFVVSIPPESWRASR